MNTNPKNPLVELFKPLLDDLKTEILAELRKTASTCEKPLTAAEIAALLRVPKNQIYRARRAGNIPGYRIGGDRGPLRFYESEVRAAMAERSKRSS